MSKFDSYFKTALTVDNVIFGFDESDLKVLLIKRTEEPYINEWGLPGYFIRPDEDLNTAARRVLRELTGLENVYLEQVKSYGGVDRHPFGRVITVAYFSLIKIADFTIKPHPDGIAGEAKWVSVASVKTLAFDHLDILNECLSVLKRQVKVRPIGFELLPPKFTLTELQHLYEAILETELDKRNFRKKMLSTNLLLDVGKMQEGVAHRPARLYEFDRERYEQFMEEGFNLDIKETRRKERELAV